MAFDVDQRIANPSLILAALQQTGFPGRSLGSAPVERASAPNSAKIPKKGVPFADVSDASTRPPSLRICSSCGKPFPVGWFRRAGCDRDGVPRRSYQCRGCRRGADAAHAARRRGAPGHISAATVRALFRRQRGCCACCGRSLYPAYHVDHVVPIARGGGNDASNLQLLCPRDNLRKGAK